MKVVKGCSPKKSGTQIDSSENSQRVTKISRNFGDIWRHLVVSEFLPSMRFFFQQDGHLSQTSVVPLGLKHSCEMGMISNVLGILCNEKKNIYKFNNKLYI